MGGVGGSPHSEDPESRGGSPETDMGGPISGDDRQLMHGGKAGAGGLVEGELWQGNKAVDGEVGGACWGLRPVFR